MQRLLIRIGTGVWALPEQLGSWLNLVGAFLRAAYQLFVGRFGLGPVLLSKQVLLAQIWFTGVQALLLIFSAGLLIAGVMMGLGYRNLAALGAESNFGDLMRLAVLSELGPLLTALIVIARSGTAITTELAGMRLNNEIDALSVHGVNPFAYLAVPRLLGVAIANLALTLAMVLAAYLGCILLAPLMQDVSLPRLVHGLSAAILPGDVLRCAVKGALFGFAIPAITLYHGITLKRDPNEVPRAGTRAVVGALIAVFAIDALMAML